MERKIALFSLACASMFAYSAAFADDFIIDTGNTITDLPSDFNGKNVDVYYTGASNQKARLGKTGGGGHTPLSLTFKSGTIPSTSEPSVTPTEWNVLGNFTFDINTASGTKTIIKDETESARINYQLGTILVKNTGAASASDASAKIDFGAATAIFNGSGSSQTPTLDTSVDLLLTSTSANPAAFYFYRSCVINVSNGATMTINALTKVSNTDIVPTEQWDSRPKINLTGGSTLVFAKTTSFYNSVVTVDETSTLTLSGASTLNNLATMNIAGTLNQTGTMTLNSGASVSAGTLLNKANLTINSGASLSAGSISPGAGKLLTVKGALTVGGGNFYQLVIDGGTANITNTGNTVLQRYTILSNGGTLQTAGYLTLQGNSTDPESDKWASLTINEGSHVYIDDATNPRMVFTNGGITFNQENAITTSSGGLVKITNKTGTEKAVLNINASQTFANIFANEKNFDIYLSTENDSTLTSRFQVDDGFLGKLIIHDFDENRICVTKMRNYSGDTLDDPNLVFTAFRTVGSEEQQIETLYVVDGWLSAIAPVPEPSTWAAILGAVALAFAIRRRK